MGTELQVGIADAAETRFGRKKGFEVVVVVVERCLVRTVVTSLLATDGPVPALA